MRRYVCQYPVVVSHIDQRADICGTPAKYETDDLQGVHFLCQAHHDEAAKWNTFRVDEV